MRAQRNVTFDIAKFIAIFLVVLGHILNEKAADPATFINFFHMPVLFFISGYFAYFSINKHTSADVMKKKVAALLLPYLCWSAISLAANAALSVLNGMFSLAGVLTEATAIFVYARSVWFLIQLFVTFLIFVAIHALLKKMNAQRYLTIVCLGVWLLFSCLIPGDILAFYKFKWLFPFFYGGYWICRNGQKLSAMMEGKVGKIAGVFSMVFPVLLWLCLQETYFVQYARFTYEDAVGIAVGLGYYALGAVGILFVMTISKWLAKCPLGGLLAEVGTYSMDIYVVHMFLIKFIPISVDFTSVSPIVVHGLLALISMVIVFAIWVAAKFILRRIKLYRIFVGMA